MKTFQAEPLVGIGVRKPKDFLSRFCVGFIADKFFVAGAFFSIIGIGWLGAHLWMRLRGVMPLTDNYATLRQLHVLIQIYLFFGTFILGFIAQAAGKLSGITTQASGKTLLWIPALASGVILWQLYPNAAWGKAIISLTFLSALAYLLTCLKQSKNPPIAVGSWLLLGLLCFAFSPYINSQSPNGALIIFWFSIFPIVIGVSQQFIAGFLNGNKISLRQSALLIALYLLASAASLTYFYASIPWAAHLWGILSVTLLATHCYLTEYWRAFGEVFKKPLPLSFISGFFWAFAGACNLAYFGALSLDMTLHLWAIGWASSLIIGVSLQILSYMCQTQGVWKKTTIAFLLCWQIVAFIRGTAHIISLPAIFHWILLSAATVTLLGWMSLLLYFEFKLLKKSALLRANDP